MDVTAFNNTPSSKEIVVPDNLYSTWKEATNWSSSTNNIVNCIVTFSESAIYHDYTTKVKYTSESGLSDWEGMITGAIAGTSSTPYYTS